MASVFDSNHDTFDLQPLRTTDASYLGGATRGAMMPQPSMLAIGPSNVAGPSAAVGGSEYWMCGIAMPAHPELVWVVASVAVLVHYGSTVSQIQMYYWLPKADPTNAEEARPPFYGPGSNLTGVFIANAGQYQATGPDVTNPTTTWLPLQPADTELGFQGALLAQAPAAGWGINDLRVEMSSIRYLGFPVNAWETGALHSYYGQRGA